MIVVDSSAVLAILLQEPDAQRFAQAIESVEQPLMSAANVIETGIVLMAREGPNARADFFDFLSEGGFHIEPVTLSQVSVALDAFAQFGKGQGNGANLNYGDCFAYALAKVVGLPLLFKGSDFTKTDIAIA